MLWKPEIYLKLGFVNMSYRFMRILVFFDLPTITTKDKKAYTDFRKYLIKSGFLMMQQSVYSKLALNQTAANNIIENLKRHKPPTGLVQAIVITEKQFAGMEIIVGNYQSSVIDSDSRLVIL